MPHIAPNIQEIVRLVFGYASFSSRHVMLFGTTSLVISDRKHAIILNLFIFTTTSPFLRPLLLKLHLYKLSTPHPVNASAFCQLSFFSNCSSIQIYPSFRSPTMTTTTTTTHSQPDISYHPDAEKFKLRVERLKSYRVGSGVPVRFPEKLTGDLVWEGKDFTDEKQWTFELTQDHLNEIGEALAHFKCTPIHCFCNIF